MKPRAEVSAVITTHNGARYVTAAVACVLAQTVLPAEILLVDDGSSDETPEIAAGLGAGVCYLRKEQGGAASARNYGAEAARCDFLAYLDVDDAWPEWKIETQWEALRKDPRAEWCTGLTQLQVEREGACRNQGRPWAAPNPGSMIYSKRLFARVGGFDTTLDTNEDLEWAMRARQAGAHAVAVDAVTLYYRLRPGSLSAAPGRQRDMLRALAKTIRRARAISSGNASEEG